MDEIDENENTPTEHLTPADQDILRSEGIEIVDGETPADKTVDTQTQEVPEPVPPPIPVASFTPRPASVIKPIRTYRSDAEEAVRKNNTSVIDIAVAESKKKQETPIEDKAQKKSGAPLWFSLTLIIIACLALGGTYYFLMVGSKTLSEIGSENSYAPLIAAESTETLPINSKSPLESLGVAIEGISSPPVGSIVNIIPTAQNGLALATSTDFFSSIGIPVPTQVALSLDGTYMLGTIISNPNHPFIILGISSFENAFAGMLAWEKTLRGDFGGFIEIDHPSEPLVALAPEMFSDTTIENQDVREILDASSTPLLMYAFVGTTKLVITTDEATMATIVTELNTTNTTR